MNIKKMLIDYITIDGVSKDEIYKSLTFTDDSSHGEVCLPCFKFSKELKKAPAMIAQGIADSDALKNCPFVSKIEVLGGYLNIFLNRTEFSKVVSTELGAGETLKKYDSNGKTITIDFSSINIAKPFHIGHLLTTVIGGSLYKIFDFLGYKVVGINHLGDWGTQFGKLISAYLKWGDDTDIADRGIRSLLDLYVRFHRDAKENPALEDEGRAWFKRIEDGDSRALKIFGKFRDITLKDVMRVYDLLGIRFDSYNGESFYNDKLDGVISTLKEKNLLSVSEGAYVVNLDDYDMPPCLILKSDGASLYATRDLATAIYRKNTYDFTENLYVVAYQQNLHFKQVFKVLELMGYDWAKDCKHIPFGMVSLEGSGALSTREGNVVFLEDVISQAIEKAEEIIKTKNPDLKDGKETAKKVGVGAVIFGAVSNNRIKDMVFSLERALNFDGETGPYIQYTHARCRSVIKKAGTIDAQPDISIYNDDDAFALIKQLNAFTAIVEESATKYEPSIISRYLIDLAKCFNKFYLTNRVITDDMGVSRARLDLVIYTADTLKKGMELILLPAPEQM